MEQDQFDPYRRHDGKRCRAIKVPRPRNKNPKEKNREERSSYGRGTLLLQQRWTSETTTSKSTQKETSMDLRQESSIGITWLTIGLLLAAIVTLSACNTVEGLGRDVESAGETVTDTAEDAQD
jgi:predicted small secreted protein